MISGQPAGYGFDSLGGAKRVQTLGLAFISRTTAAYDPSRGYAWKRLWLDPANPGTFNDPPQLWEGVDAWHPAGDTSIPVGTLCYQVVEGGSRTGYILFPILSPAVYTFGCNLENNAGVVSVDVPSLAGAGLEVQTAEGECDKLAVALGCNLDFDLDGQVAVDVFSLAGAGLEVVAGGGGCGALAAKVACGLEIDETGAITIHSADLTGDPSNTALTPFDDCTIQFDQDVASTVPITYVTDVFISYPAPGQFRLEKTYQTITDRYNVAGVLIDRVYGEPAEDTYTVDICELTVCCDYDPFDLHVDADPTSGTAPLEVDFTVILTGGSGNYSYFWDFDDGSTSTDGNTTHVFEEPGVYEVLFTVTDEDCGMTETVVTYIFVGDECDCEACEEDGFAPGYVIQLSSGTGDFLTANGAYELTHTIGCYFYGTNESGWSVLMQIQPDRTATLFLTNGLADELNYETTVSAATCCTGWAEDEVALTSSVGIGTPPTFAAPGIQASGECGPCGGTIPSDCCEELLPETLYLNFSGASANLTCLNGLKVAMPYTGDASTGWNNSGVGATPCTAGAQIAVMVCVGTNWVINYGAPGGCNGSATVAGGTCDTDVVVSGVMTFGVGTCGGGDGSGTANFTVTKS